MATGNQVGEGVHLDALSIEVRPCDMEANKLDVITSDGREVTRHQHAGSPEDVVDEIAFVLGVHLDREIAFTAIAASVPRFLA